MTGLRRLIHGVLKRLGYRISRIDVKSIDSIAHNLPDSVNAFYADPQWVQEYASPARLAFFEQIVDLALEAGVRIDGRRVCDVGCGTGHLLAAVQRRTHLATLTGYEQSRAALDVARRTCPTAVLGEIDLLRDAPTEKFDVVFCTEVLEHLVEPEVGLRSLAGMIAEGGWLVLTVPNGRKDTFEGHIQFWSPESWQHFLERDGCGLPRRSGTFGPGEAHLFAILGPNASLPGVP